jgi:3-hydroxybutyryl-CoA dehydrogenase
MITAKTSVQPPPPAECSRDAGTAGSGPVNPERAGVVGGGLMGVGIAVKFALAGFDLFLLENSPGRRVAIPTETGGILQELLDAGAISPETAAAAQARLKVTDNLADLGSLPVVIEAIPEILAAKQALYRQLEQILAPEALLASNTSGFMPDALTEGMARPERFLITHFWNPPHAIPLVEVVPGPHTAAAAIEKTVAMLRKINAEPVVLRKAVPGFIGNRLQFTILREALHLVRSGVADPETIDTVMKASLGRRYGIVGPFEAADLGGLETFLRVAAHLLPEMTSDGRELEVLQAHVDQGEKGAASGRGFYHWTKERREAVRQKRITHLLGRGMTPG